MPSLQSPLNYLNSNHSFGDEIRPRSKGIVFSPRPLLNTGKAVRSIRATPLAPSPPAAASAAGSVLLLAKPSLTSIEVESIVRQKVTENYHEIRQAFKVYDAERCTNVTKGEFRRVLDNYCLPLTTEQFNNLLSKIPVNKNGTIPYPRFLDIFAKVSSPENLSRSASKVAPNYDEGVKHDAGDVTASKTKTRKFVVTDASKEQSIDTIERQLQKKIADNLRNVVRGLQLFDYNRDGQIQRHELKRVLENYCLKMSEAQFDKLWSRYDFHHVGTVDYRDFLRRIGVNAAAEQRQLLSRQSADLGDDDAPWDAKKKKLEREKEITDLVLKRNQNRNKRKVKRTDDLSLDQIELEFRKKMRTNHANIERAMRAFDYSSDGFIEIEDLKAVVDNFVMPTSDEIFQQLMYKFAVRGTGKVSWEQFLSKFQDPQGMGNGQTLPIGQNHKVNPIRIGFHDATAPEVLTKLKKHILDDFTSVRDAFLTLDENRKGVIRRRELLRVIQKFGMKLTEENVKELFAELDPQHTGFINYHTFLDLFEPKESVRAHKWLDSSHKVNHNQPPAIMAWETVEDILREKLSENYRQVADEYQALDTVGNGTISRSHLRRLIDRYALPVSDDHFNKLWGACQEADKNRIYFSQFLDNLGIDVKPGDLEGTSTRIQDESHATESKRQDDHQMRMNDITKTSSHHTYILTAKDVIKKLKQRMSQHDTAIRRTFLKYSKSGRGKVTKKDLKMMLEEMGFVMQENQFQEFLRLVHCDKKGLTYTDFITAFEDPRDLGLGDTLERAGNHVVNKTNVKYMTAMECYQQIIERMRQNYSSVRTAFFRVDDDHDGIITMYEFRRLLDSFMFIITDETYLELLSMLGLHKKSLLSYFDFMQKFEVVDRPEGHPWLNSQHRFNTVRKPIEMTADMVHECLCLKAEQAWSDMVRTFRNFDADGNGLITRKDLRALLFRYTLPLSHEQFQYLWKKYDDEGKGFLSQAEFLQKLGRTLVPGDDLGLQGTSRKIIEDNYDNVQNHLDFQQAKHEEIAHNQALYSQHLTPERVEMELKDRFREHYADFDKAFRRIDRNKDGYVTLSDLQRALLELNYFLDEEQFMGLLKRLRVNVNKNRLSYFDFLHAIDDGRASRYGKRPSPPSGKKEQVLWQSYDHLPVDRALVKLKERVTMNYDSLNSAFRAFDRAQTGLVSVQSLRRLLDNFCFRLSDRQFRALLTKCKITNWKNDLRKMVNWVVFLHDFSSIRDTRLKEWADHVGKAAPPVEPYLMSIDEIEQRLREVVSGRYSTIANAFADTDYAKIYVVSKEDFREIIHEHIMRLTDEQFNQLWNRVPINEFNNLEYKEFLKKYGNLETLPKIEASASCDKIGELGNRRSPLGNEDGMVRNLLRRPATADSVVSRAPSFRSMSRLRSPLVNAESVESKLKSLVFRRWQEIQKECRKLDTEKTGYILPDHFIGILDRFGVILPLEEARCLMMKYDIGQKSGLFSYQEFLRNFILNMKPSEEDILKRKTIRLGKNPIDIGNESVGFVEAMAAMKQTIKRQWKEMRRTFKRYDPKFDGYVTSPCFRQILRQYAINLNEEDFYNLLSFYDPKMQGKIPYNDFIRAFLK